jgi:hypothetical protein
MAMRPARFGLRGDDGMAALLRWRDMDGFFVGRESAYEAYEQPAEEPATVTVALRGVDWLDALADRPTRTLVLGEAVLEVLDGTGHVRGDYSLWDAHLTVAAGSPNATLAARIGALPHVGGEWVWDVWRQGRPGQPGLWAHLPVGEREAWLEAAQIIAFRENRTPYPPLPDHIELDGGRVDDLASFFCALGESLAGPGGYCGASFAGLADCLRYAPRAVARPRLVWRGMAVAEKGLARTVDADGVARRCLDLALATFAEAAIDVTPA